MKKLNIQERVSLLQILPAEGDFTTLRVLRELQAALGFSEADHKKFNIRRIGDSIRWGPWTKEEIEEARKEDIEKKRKEDEARAKQMEEENPRLTRDMGKPSEIELGEKATEIVKDALLKLDKEKKLRPEHFTLYEKFIQDKEKKEEKKE